MWTNSTASSSCGPIGRWPAPCGMSATRTSSTAFRAAARLLARGSAGGLVRLQNGSLAQYAFVMLIGLVVLISVFLIFR